MKYIDMKYIVLVLSLVAVLSNGCVMTKMFVPDVDTRMSQKELTHVDKVNKDFNTTILSVLTTPTEKDKTKYAMAKLLLKSNREAQSVKPSAAENMMQQYMRMQGQGALDEQLNTGFEWSKKLIGELAGGGAAMGGLGWISVLLRRKSKALKVVNSSLGEEAKAVVKKALEHTGLEKEVT